MTQMYCRITMQKKIRTGCSKLPLLRWTRTAPILFSAYAAAQDARSVIPTNSWWMEAGSRGEARPLVASRLLQPKCSRRRRQQDLRVVSRLVKPKYPEAPGLFRVVSAFLYSCFCVLFSLTRKSLMGRIISLFYHARRLNYFQSTEHHPLAQCVSLCRCILP